MVFNFETYPNLCNLFKEINAPIKKTEMSFSVQHTQTGLEYCGSGLNGLFAQRKNIFNISYIKKAVVLCLGQRLFIFTKIFIKVFWRFE